MPFLITCRDAPDSSELRAQHLPEHRRYVDERADRILLSGPLTDDAGERRVGQVFVLDAPDHPTAAGFIQDDPFTVAGVFAYIRIDRLEMRFEGGRRLTPLTDGVADATDASGGDATSCP